MDDFENDKTDFDDEDDAPEKSTSVQRMFSSKIQRDSQRSSVQQQDFYGSQRNSGTVDESGTINELSLLDITTTGGNQTVENPDQTVEQHKVKHNNLVNPLYQIMEESKSQISNEASMKRIASSKSMTKSQNKNDQTLDDILALNDEQMDKSHKTSKSGNDISGHQDISGMRMNQSLDRSQIAYQQMINNSLLMMTPLNLSLQQPMPIVRSKSLQQPPPMFEEPPKQEIEFLQVLKKQVIYLKDRLKEEIIFKLKLVKQNDMLKKTILAKDQIIFSLNTQLQNDKYQKLLEDSKKIHDSFMQEKRAAEMSARKMLRDQKGQKEDDKSNRSQLSDNQYVSPDDQIPNKRLNIFDTSREEADQTSQMEPNSLYYLEHNNSQAKGFNKPIQAKFKQGDKSGIGGLNASNLGHSVFRDNSMLNFTNLNMSKNTALRGVGDRSRFQDPPSQSRIMLFDDIMSGIDSSMHGDEEVSRILFDKFNKSIVSNLKPTKIQSQRNSKLDKSANVHDRSALGLPDESFQAAGDRSMLRGLNLHNDDPFDKADESQLLKDVSRINDITCLISKDVTDLNTTNLYDASCLDSQLQDESCLVDKSNEVEKIRIIQQNQQNQQQNLMDQSLQVILEESQAENEVTQDEINLSAMKTKKVSDETKTSPKSSQVNKLIGFFDKTNVDQSRVSQYEKNLGDQSAFDIDEPDSDLTEAEARFMQNRKSLDSNSISRSFIVPHKKPTKEQTQKLLAQRKTIRQNKSNLSLDEKSVKRIYDRSRTYVPKKKQDPSKKVNNGNSLRRSNTIHGYDAARADNKLWKTKVDTLIAEKKSWLLERKELREKLRSLELQNDELMVRIKKVRKMMVDEDEALIGFKKMQQNYNEISQIGYTSMIGQNVMNQSYLPNDNSKLGMTAALDLDPAMMIQNPMNVTGFTNIFGAQNVSQMRQPEEKPQDIRAALAMNIKELELQNNAAEQQIINQTSFLLSTNGNNVYENSMNISQNFNLAGDISAIPNIFGGGLVSQDVSQINFGRKADESVDDGPSPSAYVLGSRNTLEEVKKQQVQRQKVVVQGDNDEVEYNESPSVTISNKLDRITERSRGAETSIKKNQSTGPKTQDRQRIWKSGGSIQKTVEQEQRNGTGIPSQILDQQIKLREKILHNDEKIDTLMEGQQRRTADFNDLQALQLQEPLDSDPNKKEGFTNLFSFFKNKMRGSVTTEMQDAVEQYKPKQRGSSHGRRDSEREQAKRDSAKAGVLRNSDGENTPKKVKEYIDTDDTPLRTGPAAMNFNNLVVERPRAKTNLEVFRGSIHEAMPGAMLPAQHQHQQVYLQQDQNKTFESFSDQKKVPRADDADGPGFGANQISPGAVRSQQHESALKGSNSNSSVNNSMSKDESRTSIKSNKFVSRIKKAEESKRITFNPTDANDFQNQIKQNLDSSQMSNFGFPEKSKDHISIDFGHIAGAPISSHKLLQPNDSSLSGIMDHSMLRGSNDKNDISNIQRDKDASYIMMNQTADLSMLQNSQYANASFLGGPLNTSQFNKSKVHVRSPGIFSDLKPKNTGESKIDKMEHLNQSSERFTLGNDQYTEEEIQEIQEQQLYLQEQQMRQRVLQQQLLHQQALIQQQQYEQVSMQTAAFPSLGASAMGSQFLMSQESIYGGQDSYLLIQQNLMRQQQMIRQNQMQQYRESFGPGQLDKGQIRNLFLQMVGRNSNESPEKTNERLQQQQQMQQQQQLQQQLQQQQQQEQMKGKQFFGNLISKKKQQQNQ